MDNERRNVVLGPAAASTLIASASDIARMIRESIIVRTIAEVPVRVITRQREAEVPADKVVSAMHAYTQSTSGNDGSNEPEGTARP